MLGPRGRCRKFPEEDDGDPPRLRQWPGARDPAGAVQRVRELSHALRALLLVIVLALAPGASDAAGTVTVGSKRFTESYLLAELVRQSLERAGVPAVHREGLGNTGILVQALGTGAIDVYPEYTGTIEREILDRPARSSSAAGPGESVAAAPGTGSDAALAALNHLLAPRGLKAAVLLGFDNTYALAMREADAARLGVRTLSDLAGLPPDETARLRLGFSHEFLVRTDGWPGLRAAYRLPLSPAGGLDHGLAYQALARGQVDLIDVYSTDAALARGRIRVLRDDRRFFPRYEAVLLMRADLDPTPLAAALEGRIDQAAMVALNARVELDGASFAQAAREFLDRRATGPEPRETTPARFRRLLLGPDLPRLLAQHLALVAGSLLMAVLAGVPLGLWAFRRPAFEGMVMGTVGVLQTVPALALLAALIALLGTIGFLPALLALFVYALLPVVRNTHAGLASVPRGQPAAALALGLRPTQVLRFVELPQAAPTLLAGIKTAAVVNVGTATVAAFVGAGGLGERIVAGLAVNDPVQMMAGAVPAALLALLVQWGFELLERRRRIGPD